MMDDEKTGDEKLQLYRSKPQNRYIVYESIVHGPSQTGLPRKTSKRELLLGPNPLFSGLQHWGVFFRLLLGESRNSTNDQIQEGQRVLGVVGIFALGKSMELEDVFNY